MDKADTMMPHEFTISVVMPVYNAQATLRRALDSVLTQSLAPHEIIVVDDGSTDHSADILRNEYRDRVRYLHQDNAGPSAARNLGIHYATGQWVAFLDNDDEWAPDKLQRQVSILAEHPDLVWATGNCRHLIESDGRSWLDRDPNEVSSLRDSPRETPRETPREQGLLIEGGCVLADFLRGFPHHLCGNTITMLIRRDVLIEAGLFLPGQRFGEDIDLWWRIAYRYPRAGYDPQPLAVYHKASPASLSQQVPPADEYGDFIARHLALAEEQGRVDSFEAIARFLLPRYVRTMLFEGRGDDARDLLRRFPGYYPRWFRCPARLAAGCPRVTARVLGLLSRSARALRITSGHSRYYPAQAVVDKPCRTMSKENVTRNQ